MSPLLDSAGPRFTCQMCPLHLYLEADQASQVQQVQNCVRGLSVSHPARLCQGPPVSARPAPNSSQPPDPRSAFKSPSSSPPHPAIPKACSSHFQNIHSLITSPQTLSSLLVSWMTVKGQVVFHFCPRIHSAHFLVLTREISEKCKSENTVSLSPSPTSEAQDNNQGP